MTKSPTSPASLKTLARALAGRALGFRDCPPQALDSLLAEATLRSLQRGEFLSRRGDPFRSVFMVVQGVVESSMLRPDGDRHLTGLLLPGDFVALTSLVDQLPHSHDLSAREPSVIACVPSAAMRALRAEHPSLVLACERQLVARLRLSFERLGVDAGMALDVRLAGMLQMLSRLYGRPTGTAIEFDVKLSQADLADWLGLSRQRVNFALKQLEAEGLVALRYSKLSILQPDALAQRAAS